MNDNQIVNAYLSGLTAQAVAKKAGFKSHVSILSILGRNGVKCRSRSENMMGKRRALKHGCDDGFFDTIRTQKQAYLLGLLMADGNVMISHEQGYRVSFSSVDKELVELVKGLLKATHPIRPRKDGGWEIVLSSPRLTAGLIKNGCGERKSLTIAWPRMLAPMLNRHFVRGVFDGDGGVGFDKKGNARWSIVGSREFVHTLADVIGKDVGFTVRPRPHGAIWRVGANGNHRAKRMASYIYRGARYWLSRKRLVFDSIVTKYVKNGGISCG